MSPLARVCGDPSRADQEVPKRCNCVLQCCSVVLRHCSDPCAERSDAVVGGAVAIRSMTHETKHGGCVGRPHVHHHGTQWSSLGMSEIRRFSSVVLRPLRLHLYPYGCIGSSTRMPKSLPSAPRTSGGWTHLPGTLSFSEAAFKCMKESLLQVTLHEH
eukprot:1100730-Amphidinium_carterae.1